MHLVLRTNNVNYLCLLLRGLSLVLHSVMGIWSLRQQGSHLPEVVQVCADAGGGDKLNKFLPDRQCNVV